MTPALRKFVLTAHVVSSVGWLGAVAAFLALAVAGLTGGDVRTVQAADLAMSLTGWYVIVPLCLASLLTGLVQSLGTPWGLFRHYWVVVKLVLTVVSGLVLLDFTRTLGSLGALATDASRSVDELRELSQSPVLHSGGGLVVLLAITAFSVYKPRGLTPYGQRKGNEERRASQP